MNSIVHTAIARTTIIGDHSAHNLRSWFFTHAHLRGASDRAIAHQTRHCSLAGLGQYGRVNDAWTDNAASQLGLQPI